MRALTIIMRGLAWMIIAMLVTTPAIHAQDTGQEEQPYRFSKEELTQMLAPIALYPDSLIAQILMASTYPLEVVEAERFMRQNSNLKGNELDNALLEKTWDPSVKSLCHFTDVLFAMSDKLDQTRKLGDAFLSQEGDVMDTIQELRRKAEDLGNLKSDKEQKVLVEREIIRIEPADPEVVYVPIYNPLYVYGPWWYPAYPPYYWYYPPAYPVTGFYIGFAPPVYIGIGFFSWAWFDWPYHRIDVDMHRTPRFYRYDHRRDFDRHVWEHNPYHRRGVAYRDRVTSQRFFGSKPRRVSPVSPEMRGYPGRRMERQGERPSQVPFERRERTGTPEMRREPSGSGGAVERRQSAGAPKIRTERGRIQASPERDTPFRGIGQGNFERKASERGGMSRQSGREIRRSDGTSRQGVRQDGNAGRRGGDGTSRQGIQQDGNAGRKSGNTGRPGRESTGGGGFRR